MSILLSPLVSTVCMLISRLDFLVFDFPPQCSGVLVFRCLGSGVHSAQAIGLHCVHADQSAGLSGARGRWVPASLPPLLHLHWM